METIRDQILSLLLNPKISDDHSRCHSSIMNCDNYGFWSIGKEHA